MKYFLTVILANFVILGAVPVQAESIWNKNLPNMAATVPMTVYRSPSCGCCGIWLEHMKKHNFEINDVKTNDVQSIKQKYGIKGELASCHTALVGGYLVEGHVPAEDIHTLLKEQPKILGLSVPGMPHGTPGMEMSGQRHPFSVISFDKNGEQKVFRDYSFY